MSENYDIDQEMLADFIDESLESLSTIPGLFVEFETNPSDLSLIEAVFRPVHSLKGNAAYFGLMRVKSLAHDLESVLDLLRKEKLLPDREIIDGLLAGVDELYEILDKTRVDGRESIEEARFEAVHDRVKMLLEKERVDAQQPVGGQMEPTAVAVAGDETAIWSTLFATMSLLKEMPKFQDTDDGLKLLAAESMLQEIAPHESFAEEVSLQASPSSESSDVIVDGNLLASLLQLLKNPPKGMSLDEEAKTVLKLLQDLAEMATVDEAKSLINNALEEYDLFVSRIGYDDMLKESLVEACQNLESLQDWSANPDTGDVASQEPVVAAPMEVAQEVGLESVPEAESEVESEPEPVSVQEEPSYSGSSAGAQSSASKKKKAQEPARTMRISEERVDVFLSYVGELIAVDEMLRYIHSEMVRRATDLQISSALLRIVNTFTKLSDDLQNSIMEIRKVSVKPMLQKTQRIVRDIAARGDKLIDTTLHGEEVTIDRSLVETLEAPMVHMIRNAADHGIEAPDERLAAGKKERGTISVNMTENEEMIILTVADDGKGLNFEGIRGKAVKMGILKEGAPVTEEVLKDVIFASGFSTAEKITDVSGRGVGMDAVKRAVEDAGGSIDIKTEEGKGTEFRISLPKSVGTQILNSFVVQIGEERFVLPMDKISGSFKSEAHFNRLPSGTVCVKRKQNILPVVSLDGPYNGDIEPLTKGILVTIENRGNPFAFYVDTILGMQKVVLRHIPWINPDKFLGAAIMGDGRVSMIVNVMALGESITEEGLVPA